MHSTPAPEAENLRAGRTVWELDEPPPSLHAPAPPYARADVVIVGAGVTGAFMAERLTREGRSVIVIDRHAPQQASTAASTALLLWEIDAPLLALEDRLGLETAAAIYRRSFAAVGAIADRTGALRADCAFAWRPSLYLAGTDLDAPLLREECALRHRARLPSTFLGAGDLSSFAIARDGALRSIGAAEADPVRLARALMNAAIARGARVFAPEAATHYESGAGGVDVVLISGAVCRGDVLVLANGYEMPPMIDAARHRIGSTWAVATAQQREAALWPEHALIWEASTPYLYARTTREGRIVIGGADEDCDSAERRSALIPAKSAALRAQIGAFAPAAETVLDAAWSGAFGETDDALPLVGPVPGQPRCYAAFGYGGNGITFSAMAADIIATLIAGGSDPAADWFAVNR